MFFSFVDRLPFDATSMEELLFISLNALNFILHIVRVSSLFNIIIRVARFLDTGKRSVVAMGVRTLLGGVRGLIAMMIRALLRLGHVMVGRNDMVGFHFVFHEYGGIVHSVVLVEKHGFGLALIEGAFLDRIAQSLAYECELGGRKELPMFFSFVDRLPFDATSMEELLFISLNALNFILHIVRVSSLFNIIIRVARFLDTGKRSVVAMGVRTLLGGVRGLIAMMIRALLRLGHVMVGRNDM